MPERLRTSFLGVFGAHQFPDGRVGAIVVYDSPAAPSPAESSYWVFRFEDGIWKLDDVPGETGQFDWGGSGTPTYVFQALTPQAVMPCLAERLTDEEISSIVGLEPEARPIPHRLDNAVGEQELSEIDYFGKQWVSCINSGDARRVYSMFTPIYTSTIDPDDVTQSLMKDTKNRSTESAVRYLGVVSADHLSDGRIGASFAFSDPLAPGPVQTLYVVLDRQQGHLLLDSIYSSFEMIIRTNQ